MQWNLGVLPMQQNQAMAGSPMMQMPPPPQVMHPSEAAIIAMQRHNDMVQNTLMAAQVTRYQPPPSAPMPSISSTYAASSPFMGGGGVSSPFSMGAGGMGASSYVPRMPSVFNPFAPTLPQSHFASPAMHNLQMMHHNQSQTMGMMAGGGEAALGIGGSMLGGAIGTYFGGALGGMAGSWLGNKVGGAVANTMFNPVVQDFQRGRQIQAMTSPFMVSGSSLNTATGQGMDSHAARQVASGIRHMNRDLDFEKTGFNTQDAMRMMQMSADQGLLTGANTPDQLVQKVKDISKTVKVLMRITGDPDVRDAIASLGQMRDIGFNGLASQAGAVANRAMFARQAGMSQAQMNATMMAGAEIAGTMGLVGATGANASMAGAGAANVAASSGAMNDLQLARAGGRGGLGQIASAGALSAMQNERYLLAGSRVGAGGKLELDMGAFRRAQSTGFDEVNKLASENLQHMQARGIFDWNTRKQELKDEIAQRLKPGEMQMMMLQQAQSFMKAVPNMTLGTALQQTTGLSADRSRSLEAMYTSRKYWDGMIQQSQAQLRDARDQDRAYRDQFATPSIATRARRSVRGFLGDISDTISSPFRRASEYFDRVGEERDAAANGETITRYSEDQIARTEQERAGIGRAFRNKGFQAALAGGGSNFLDSTSAGLSWTAGRYANRLTSKLGLTSESNENLLLDATNNDTTSEIRGYVSKLVPGMSTFNTIASFFGSGSGTPQDRESALSGYRDVARGMSAGRGLTGASRGSFIEKINNASNGGKGLSVMSDMTRNLMYRLDQKASGVVTSASKASGEDMETSFMDAAVNSGAMHEADAKKFWNENKTFLIAHMTDSVRRSGNKKLIEPLTKAEEAAAQGGGVDYTRGRDTVEARIKGSIANLGLDKVSEKTLTNIKALVTNNDMDVVKLATVLSAETDTSFDSGTRKGMEKVRDAMFKRLGAKKFGDVMDRAARLQGGLDKDTQEALSRQLLDANSEGGLGNRLAAIKETADERRGLAAYDQGIKELAKINPAAANAKTLEEALDTIQESDLQGMSNQHKASVIRKMKAGDEGAKAGFLQSVAPTSTTTRNGSNVGDSVQAVNDSIDDLQESADKFAKDVESGGDTTQDIADMQEKATQSFAHSVELFGQYVKGATGNDQGTHLDVNTPQDVSSGLAGSLDSWFKKMT
jgi:hypothetical protein